MTDPTLDEAQRYLSLTVLRSDGTHIQSHVHVALESDVTPEEILEAIEITLPEAGAVALHHGFDAWREVVDAPALDPTPPH